MENSALCFDNSVGKENGNLFWASQEVSVTGEAGSHTGEKGSKLNKVGSIGYDVLALIALTV